MQKPNIFLKCGCRVCRFCRLCLAVFIVSTCAGAPALCGSGPAGCCSGPLVVCSTAFCPLCCSSLAALSANMALSRVLKAFLGGFVGLVWVCVVLALCVVCGAFVCVRG